MENNITFDERDINDYRDMEYYIIERAYEVTLSEYLILKRISKSFGVKNIQYNYKDIDQNRIDFLVDFVFHPSQKEEFHCWTRVLKEEPNKIRHRKLTLSAEDIKEIKDFVEYIKERKYMLNHVENSLLQEKARQLKVQRCSQELPPGTDYEKWSQEEKERWSEFRNQTVGKLHFNFSDGQYIGTRIMYYKENVLERKRNEEK